MMTVVVVADDGHFVNVTKKEIKKHSEQHFSSSWFSVGSSSAYQRRSSKKNNTEKKTKNFSEFLLLRRRFESCAALICSFWLSVSFYVCTLKWCVILGIAFLNWVHSLKPRVRVFRCERSGAVVILGWCGWINQWIKCFWTCEICSEGTHDDFWLSIRQKGRPQFFYSIW